jgi:hypothetical protein
MSRVITSLNQISQQYTVFTKDQVLTEQQLNSITTYLDDQQRLTRTALSGVGIVQGLQVNLLNSQIELSQGLGITRDGDLFTIYESMLFDRVKAYPEDGPEYPPFMKEETRLPLYELVEKSEKDELAKPLSSFEAISGTELKKCLFILFAESIIEDKDLCTGTDCDNGSHTYHNRMKLLCIDAKFAELFTAKITMPAPSEQEMTRLYVPTIRFDAKIDTQSEWFNKIRQSCEASAKLTLASLSNFWSTYKPYLQDYVEGNPTTNWLSKLQAIVNKGRTENTRLPYYYEFLHDVSNTWNELLDELEQARPSMLVSASINSKHLLLGGFKASLPRSGFIASPIHAQNAMLPVLFYIEKLSKLINGYGWTHISALKITPSVHTLPSVPGFYNEAVFDSWQYIASKANKSRYLLGYHADKNKPLGGAESPLNRMQASFDFYRIEGVLGKAFSAINTSITNLIKANHLPISVTGVLIEGDFERVIKPIFPFRNNLTQFGYLLKKDLSYQLQDVSRFSGLFKNEVVTKSAKEDLLEGEQLDLGAQVKMRDREINNDAQKAISFLNKPSLSSAEKVSFTASLNNVVKNAGLFKNDVSKVSSTHFPTMFDQIIVNPSSRWIDWLDILQKADEKEEKEKSQLPQFLNQYPGFEVSNGVVRGGTFVLVYNAGGTIVGTGMLSHYIPIPIEKVSLKPELPKFEFPLDLIPLPGIEIKPSFDFEVNRKITDFSMSFTQQVDSKLANNSSYISAFQDSIKLVSDLNLKTPPEGKITLPPRDKVDVPGINDALAGIEASRKEVAFLDEKILKARTQKEKAVYAKRKEGKQAQMADDIVYVASVANNDTSLDTDTTNKIVETLSLSGKSLTDNKKALEKVNSFVVENERSAIAVKLGKSLGFARVR